MIRPSRIALGLLAAGAALAVTALTPTLALACPFCSAVSLTFSEEIANSQVAVIAKLVEPPPRPNADAPNSSLDVAKAKFEIIKILKGEKELGTSRKIETVYFGDSPVGSTFLIMGIDPPAINWGTPIAISERGQAYVAKSIELPKEGADRLAFFQDYLEDSDEMLARDAYDEFAKTPYAGVIGLKDRMKHDKLIEWIKSPQIPASRRRLYLTMLGVCGKPEDLPMLEDDDPVEGSPDQRGTRRAGGGLSDAQGARGHAAGRRPVPEEQGRRIHRHLCHDHGAAVSRHRRKDHSQRAAAGRAFARCSIVRNWPTW